MTPQFINHQERLLVVLLQIGLFVHALTQVPENGIAALLGYAIWWGILQWMKPERIE